MSQKCDKNANYFVGMAFRPIRRSYQSRTRPLESMVGATLPAAPSVRSAKPRHFSMTEVDDDSVFDVDRFLLFGQEGSYPAVSVDLCAVPAVVLIRRDDQLLGRAVCAGLRGWLFCIICIGSLVQRRCYNSNPVQR